MYHHPSCEECREERSSTKTTEVNQTSQLESFMHLSGSGFHFRTPDSRFYIRFKKCRFEENVNNPIPWAVNSPLYWLSRKRTAALTGTFFDSPFYFPVKFPNLQIPTFFQKNVVAWRETRNEERQGRAFTCLKSLFEVQLLFFPHTFLRYVLKLY